MKDRVWTEARRPVDLPFPKTTMYGAIAESASRFPQAFAYEFMGKKVTYADMMKGIDKVAKALMAHGVRRGDAVTIAMPNTPQALWAFYAVSRLGAIANMIHPLSSQKEITFYLDDSESVLMITMDMFYDKAVKARAEAKNAKTEIIVCRMEDELPPVLAAGFFVKDGRKFYQYPDRPDSCTWRQFLKSADLVEKLPDMVYDPTRAAVYLYSGGTSGTPKGIMLTDDNFNALGIQIRSAAGVDFLPGMKFLSVMPMFHGFGLGIGFHTVLENGMMCIIVPQFTAASYSKLVRDKKPNFIAAVPTLYAAMMKNEAMKNADLSCLKGVFSGGDTLPPELKHEFDQFLKEHKATVMIREGYGLTECVTASCLTPVDRYKENSIGLPLRDMEYAVVNPGTFDELPRGEEGEIILRGPTVMIGYHNRPEDNAETMKTDDQGRTWVFTGDAGIMDEEGFVYFKQRLKRMIITSGYNVYPSQLENVLLMHPDVDSACVIGIPDPVRMQRIRAYVVLKPGVDQSEAEKEKLIEHCKLYVAGYAKPREIIFRDDLPKTLVGKVAYHVLEEEAEAERKAAEANETAE